MLGTSDPWSFVPSTHRPSISYWRLSDFNCHMNYWNQMAIWFFKNLFLLLYSLFTLFVFIQEVFAFKFWLDSRPIEFFSILTFSPLSSIFWLRKSSDFPPQLSCVYIVGKNQLDEQWCCSKCWVGGWWSRVHKIYNF